MSETDDIRAIAAEARPAIQRWLDAAELIAGFREAATAKGLNWSALKAVIVASIKDDEDGGDRVKKLADKADDALTYADALGKKIKFSGATPAPHKSPPVSVSVAAVQGETINPIADAATRVAAAVTPPRAAAPPAATESEPAVLKPLIQGDMAAPGEGDPASDPGLCAGSPPSDVDLKINKPPPGAEPAPIAPEPPAPQPLPAGAEDDDIPAFLRRPFVALASSIEARA